MGRPKTSETFTSREDYMEAWYAALNAPVGVAVSAFPRDAVYARLNQIRKEIGDPELFRLEILKPSHAENELWLVKKRS